MITTLPFHDYETIAYEETPLKQEIAARLGLPYSQNGVHNAVFYNFKFPQEVLKQVRLSFLTSRTLIDNGGRSFLDNKDLSEMLDPLNE